ncbi:bifunctional adenosylcobinamide kinase/adenosylcobinamide-phosphate guanylyltransferase [Novosphingobium sp. FGD1]|jgi:adenosylcobinamide kinase/adenosylcobinamide-phosphate guanylyltransferase|uniref:Bifunctional adenosylcobalamin biosynthesis protein n=1 Tax=Novosphingobium silvae TaxID=2692619 RepID=A0A7X4GDM9_9SPHN|nr:bifunctional adenosylcobinamide kinase/adenosylcobinamide-phosphate guanylyltransferase [Novosphingobium silvae]MYL96708.1 bifunctional adenosylcobinamide kinase/adenosylcobinamide-phosphate guanylyltransferase [Novosphingobium silvae]
MTTSLLVLGGARSGKSRYAQGRAEALAGNLVYIATAQAFDAEMTERIVRHRDDRGPRWTTLEEPFDLAGTIARASDSAGAVLVDCLTLWLSNLMLAQMPPEAATHALADAIARCPCPIVLVSNEVGLGIVPDNALARAFRDEAGRLNQTIAAQATEVQFIAAGLPLRLK